MSELSPELKLEIAWREAKNNVLFAASKWSIKHPLGPRKWDLYPAQREILSAWATGGNYLHLKARQLGFSTSVGFFAWWTAFFNEGVSVLLISKGERESARLLDMMLFGYDRLPAWMKDRGPQIKSRTQSKVVFDNESEVVSLPSASDPARGFTGRLIIVDEWAFMENSEDAWASIQPTADIGGQIIGLSTANGSGNLFHQLWVNAEEGQGSFTPMFYSWRAVPSRDDEWYQRTKQDLPQQWMLHQEYPSDPEEAFIKSGATVFDTDAVRSKQLNSGLRMQIHGAGTASCRLVPHADGFCKVFEEAQPMTAYVIGVDTAEGLAHGDFSSAHVMDAKTGCVVAVWHGHIPADLLAHQIYSLGLIYNTALLVVEANNHGLTTLTELRRLGYPKIWRRRAMNQVTKKVSIEFGFKTTKGTKAPLIDGLGTWIRKDDTEFWDEGTMRELITYVRDERGRMQGSPHDDRVMSLALAVHGLEYVHLPEYRVQHDDYLTFDWWVREALSNGDQDDFGRRGIAPLRTRSLSR